jgi:hypothetical protein
MRLLPSLVAAAAGLLWSLPALAQYTPSAGMNAPAAAYELRAAPKADAAERHTVIQTVPTAAPVSRDSHGNATGNQYDLAVDGAFEGQTVLILDEVGNTLVNTRAALKQKGLNSVVYSRGGLPPANVLREALKKSCELWLLSFEDEELNDDQIAAIKEYFDAGHGVYIWGDNDPYYVDANRVANALIPGLRMEGNLAGTVVMGIAYGDHRDAGLRLGHLVTTGIERLYEGVTIATVQFTKARGRNEELYDGPGGPSRAPALPAGFTPILYGSAKNLVTVAYEKDGKRLIMDGGFTRLAVNWDDAGTARYVKNAAAWLVNAERFKDTVATQVAQAK